MLNNYANNNKKGTENMKKLMYRNSIGEWFPYDKTDKCMVSCCEHFNAELREHIRQVELAKNMNLVPIQKTLTGKYRTTKEYSKFFRYWIKYQNRLVDRRREEMNHGMEAGNEKKQIEWL